MDSTAVQQRNRCPVHEQTPKRENTLYQLYVGFFRGFQVVLCRTQRLLREVVLWDGMARGEHHTHKETYASLVESKKPDSEKTRAEFRRERDEWRHLFNQLIADFPEPIFAVDDQRRLRYFNESAEEAYGRSKNEAIGTKGYDFFGTEGESEILAETVARKGETIWEKEFRKVPTPDGHLWNRSMAVHVTNLDGETVGAVEMTPIVTDIVKQRNGMQDAQDKLSEEINEAITKLRTTAREVAAGSTESSDLARDQSETLDRIASEIANVSASVEEVASTAQQVEQQSSRAEQLADDGAASATAALEMMTDVTDSAEAMEQRMTALQGRINEIDSIVEVINNIADQTNMLALNASIEAARAGSGAGNAGDGFAVVADEVKSLAEESKRHASRIEEMIREVEQTASETVESIQQTNGQLTDAVSQTETVSENLVAINDEVQQTAQGMEDVAAAMDDQATGTEAVAGLIDDVSTSAERLATEITTIAEANQHQSELVESIEKMVATLETEMAALSEE